MLRAARILPALLTLAALPLGAQQGRDESTFVWSRSLAPNTMLTISNGDGPITIREAPSGSDKVEVHATKIVRSRGSIQDVAFDVRETADQVEICTLYGRQTSCRDRGGVNNVRVRVEYVVTVPRSSRLRVGTGNGAVSIERAGADVSASTGNGRVTVGETAGRVNVSTGNGDVDVMEANGPVKVSTGNGRVSVTTAKGSVDATTGNGDIDVRIKALPVENDMHFSSGSGSIRVMLPTNYNGRIDAMSGNGDLSSDFEIAIVGKLDAHHIRGTIGSGGPLLRLSTGSGPIELRKK
jgi:DUF4097 and DUF4098 domain-containing protein YvlB